MLLPRIFLNEPLRYVNIDENHSLYIEPGDELTVTLDALGGKKIEMTGQGAGNNRYYHGDGANWGYSLYRIDREKLCSRDYYKALDEQYAKSQLTAPGSTAPEFTLQDLAGKKFSLSDFRGKVVYIDFWSMGCGPCMYEFKNHAPQLKEHYKDKDVVFLNLMAYTRNKDFWKKMIEEYRIGGVNAMDTQGEEVCKAYHVNSFPTYVLIGKDGKIVQYNTCRPSEGERLKELIDKALE